jgi:probable LLM family oxidoreductase
VEIGLSSFAETTPDPVTGAVVSAPQRLREVVEEVELADQVGLDVYGLGEHHRADFAASAPAVVLAAAAARTHRIRLTSAVTVLSSADPVRTFQDFATLDGLSDGRAEIIAGRGSFIESFPLFGQSLDDYDALFAEKLDLLLALRASERVTWSGQHRPPLHDAGVYPRPVQQPLPVWVGVGGNPQSVLRAASLDLPLALAIIGGMPEQFAPLTQLYRQAHAQLHPGPAGTGGAAPPVAVHSHGFVAPTTQEAKSVAYPSVAAAMNAIGRERGWAPYTRATFDAATSPRGAFLAGSPAEVAEKILLQRGHLGHDRFMLHISVGTLPHAQVMRGIELLGTQVAPIVRAAVASELASA